MTYFHHVGDSIGDALLNVKGKLLESSDPQENLSPVSISPPSPTNVTAPAEAGDAVQLCMVNVILNGKFSQESSMTLSFDKVVIDKQVKKLHLEIHICAQADEFFTLYFLSRVASLLVNFLVIEC